MQVKKRVQECRKQMVESRKICYFGIMCYVICYLFHFF